MVNRLRKAHVQNIIKDFGPEYDKLWIFSKIHHEMNQLCSKSTLQEIYVDKFDQARRQASLLLQLMSSLDKS